MNRGCRLLSLIYARIAIWVKRWGLTRRPVSNLQILLNEKSFKANASYKLHLIIFEKKKKNLRFNLAYEALIWRPNHSPLCGEFSRSEVVETWNPLFPTFWVLMCPIHHSDERSHCDHHLKLLKCENMIIFNCLLCVIQIHRGLKKMVIPIQEIAQKRCWFSSNTNQLLITVWKVNFVNSSELSEVLEHFSRKSRQSFFRSGLFCNGPFYGM